MAEMWTKASARGPAIGDGHRLAFDLEVAGRNASAAVHERELERLALGQAGEARLLDRRDVHEHILAAIIADDEAEALLAVEEFDDALGLADHQGGHAAAAAAATAAKAATTAAAKAASFESAAAVAVFAAERIALVSSAPAAFTAAPSIKSHEPK
jgi:ribosomal protein L18